MQLWFFIFAVRPLSANISIYNCSLNLSDQVKATLINWPIESNFIAVVPRFCRLEDFRFLAIYYTTNAANWCHKLCKSVKFINNILQILHLIKFNKKKGNL